MKKEYDCKRCHWTWVSKLDREPRVCPRCKSYQWKQKKENK